MVDLTEDMNKLSNNTDSKEGREHMRPEKEQADVEKMDQDSMGKPQEKAQEGDNELTQMT